MKTWRGTTERGPVTLTWTDELLILLDRPEEDGALEYPMVMGKTTSAQYVSKMAENLGLEEVNNDTNNGSTESA